LPAVCARSPPPPSRRPPPSASPTPPAWPPLPDARDLTLSYEVRRRGTRRGPDELWHRFDNAVADLADALQGVALSAIARAFTMLADVTHTLADEIDQLNSHS
jgi:hypothetical protein